MYPPVNVEHTVIGYEGNPDSDRALAAALANNVMTARTEWFRRLLDPRRNINAECGFPEANPDSWFYWDLFDREAVARRCCTVFPMEMFQVQPVVYDSEKVNDKTPFNVAVAEVGRTLGGEQSYFQGDETNVLNQVAQMADVLAGVGRYSVIVYGIDDGLSMEQPAAGVVEQASMPGKAPKRDEAGKVIEFPQTVVGNYALTFNASPKQTRRLAYCRVFPEVMAEIAAYETNWTSPRFGQPVLYNITFNDPRENRGSAIGLPIATKQVHWSRVVHVPSEGSTDNVHGVEEMRPVLNHLLSLRKPYYAGAEGYWKSCFAALSLETHPQLGGDVRVNRPRLQQMMESFDGGLQRWIELTGMTAKTLAPSVVDPTPHIDKHIEAICIAKNVPMRKFKGSERGELASSQDDGDWNDELRRRMRDRGTPRLIVPMYDRLINLGCLPKPAKYRVYWPELDAQSAGEKADIANKKTTAISTYTASGASAWYPEQRFLVDVLGYTEDAAEAVLKEASEKASGDSPASETPSPLLGLVGGITGMLEMFAKFKEGALGEETLKQLIMLFYKVDDARAEDIIADGLPEPPTPELPAVPPLKGFGPKKPASFALPPATNKFCPTGPGGGVDPTCSIGAKGTKGAKGAAKTAKPARAAKTKLDAPAADGKRTAPPELSEKAQRAKANHKLVDKTIQRYAEEGNEPKAAKTLGGLSFKNNEPVDIVLGDGGVVKHGVELKTMVDNANAKITMKKSAMDRKAAWEKEKDATFHTIVIDDAPVFAKAAGLKKNDTPAQKTAKISAAIQRHLDGEKGVADFSKRQIYYRRGFGSFRVGTMHKVKSLAEAKRLMDVADADLPDAAKRPAKKTKE